MMKRGLADVLAAQEVITIRVQLLLFAHRAKASQGICRMGQRQPELALQKGLKMMIFQTVVLVFADVLRKGEASQGR
jgi:hypothetical protein